MNSGLALWIRLAVFECKFNTVVPRYTLNSHFPAQLCGCLLFIWLSVNFEQNKWWFLMRSPIVEGCTCAEIPISYLIIQKALPFHSCFSHRLRVRGAKGKIHVRWYNHGLKIVLSLSLSWLSFLKWFIQWKSSFLTGAFSIPGHTVYVHQHLLVLIDLCRRKRRKRSSITPIQPSLTWRTEAICSRDSLRRESNGQHLLHWLSLFQLFFLFKLVSPSECRTIVVQHKTAYLKR